MVVEQRESSQSDNYFIGDPSISTSNQNLLLGYSASGTVIHSQAGTSSSANSNSYSATVVSYSSAAPKIFIFTSSASSGKKTYLNGTLIASSSNTDAISNLSTLQIGKGYNGQIGELAIYTRSLNNDEIVDITKYAGKKWGIKTAASLSSCIGGTVDNSNNCNNNCPISTTGISASSVAYGNNSLTCSGGYSGTVNYTCSGGVATPSGTCTITGGGSYFGNSGAGNYRAQLDPFGAATSTSDATFQAWFASNNCVTAPAGVGSSPGSYNFSNGQISNSPSGDIVWMTTPTTKYWKTSAWQSMFSFSGDFASNIAAIGCAQ